MNGGVVVVNGKSDVRVAALVRSRLAVGLSLSVVMVVIYFGFMALFAFDKPLLGVILAPGLSLGILLGPLLIISSFILCVAYIAWANAFLDPGIDAVKPKKTDP